MYIIKGIHSNEIKIKGSLFKILSYETENLKNIKKILSKLEKNYSDSSHICYSYRICNIKQLDLFYNPEIIEFSTDDGEPPGTAGKPILNILKKYNIINRTIFVIRYFGGIKLGIPGLIDAYKKSAELILKNLPKNKWILYKELKFEIDYNYLKVIKKIAQKYNGDIKKSEFSDNIKLKINFPLKNLEIIKNEVKEKGNGRIKLF